MKFSTMTQAYLHILHEVYHSGAKSSPRGMPIRELLNFSFTLQGPVQPDIDFTQTGMPERQPVYTKYLAAEHKWYLSGNLRADSAPSKFWLKLADDKGNIVSNYGYITMFDRKYPNFYGETTLTGVEWAASELIRDTDSRRAVIQYGEPKHFFESSLDVPCCVMNQFFIRNNQLSMSILMRSNDVTKGLTYDIFWFTTLMYEVFNRLKTAYPNLTLGDMHYSVGSLHMYESDETMVKKILG